MQNIETGYKPEFGLGAWFAGQNAANTEAANEEELIKSFLANQRERQMQPIDIQRKQYDNQVAQYNAKEADAKRTSPTYIPWMLKGYEGQMKTQDAAGEKAQTLLPFQTAADRSKLVDEEQTANLLSQFKEAQQLRMQGGDIDEQGVLHKFSPQQAQAIDQRIEGLKGILSNTPQQANAIELLNLKNDAMLEKQQRDAALRERLAELKAQSDLDRANARGDKALSDKQLYAQAVSIVTGMVPSTPQQMQAAQAALLQMQADAVERNAAMSTPTIDLGAASGGSVPMTTPPAAVARERANAALAASQGGGVAPQQQQPVIPTLTPQDRTALDWANNNPNDPRAAAIKKKLGVK